MRRSSPLALLAGLALAGPALAQPVDWAEHYRKRVAAFTAENAGLDPSRRSVVLVGDSLTEGFSAARVRRFLPSLAGRVLNRGISSDGVGLNARGVKHRLDSSVFDCRPSHVVLLIGVNDIGRDGSGIERTVRVLREVVAAIRARLPDVPLILVRVAPGRGAYAAWGPALRDYGARVGALAAELGLPSIDLMALLAGPDGLLPAAMTTDGLHWTDAAYEVYGRAIEAAVAAASGGAAPPAPTPPTPPAPPDVTPLVVEVTASSLRVRETPAGAILGAVPRGTRLEALELRNGWYRVRWSGREGWISATYARRVAGLSGALPGQ